MQSLLNSSTKLPCTEPSLYNSFSAASQPKVDRQAGSRAVVPLQSGCGPGVRGQHREGSTSNEESAVKARKGEGYGQGWQRGGVRSRLAKGRSAVKAGKGWPGKGATMTGCGPRVLALVALTAALLVSNPPGPSALAEAKGVIREYPFSTPPE